ERLVEERLLPGPEALVRLSVGADPLARAVGLEPERVPLGEVVGGERHVAGVGARRRPCPPQQVPADTALVRDERHAEVGAQLPGARCRPHVKAHKTTALAREQGARGHRTFTCATPREMEGMAHAGLGDDLLLANEVVDPDRLRRLAALDARVTVAVDSEATIDAAARAGLGEVVIDAYVGMPRCGCPPDRAGRLADAARSRGLTVRGVMGYEGHVVGVHDRGTRVEQTEISMRQLLDAHADVGGELVSGGGTGTFDINTWVTEIQAGSYALMDTAYGHLDLPFELALSIVATVISVSEGWAVADCGLKALGMDHGDPTVIGHTVWF